ncbi:hypothetical protein RV15_GL002748 [Enterococcus silesiacus]|uniref:Pyoverdine biosynthesis protein n=1 Tax=Enterococcus silesiacus TaxID=332949 RepID=A0AA91GCS8_9ENTE|nr:hypothetical protein RV15_GL002748 [Enterococcus silesiacus]
MKENINEILDTIEQNIIANKAIPIILPAYPGRALNLLQRTRPEPDLGEVASFTRFALLTEHVEKYYDNGLKFIIILDGRAYSPFYGYTPESVRLYPRDLKKIAKKLDMETKIEFVDIQDLVDERIDEYNLIYSEAEKEIESKWNDPTYTFKEELIHSMKMGSNVAPINAAAMKFTKYYNSDDDTLAQVDQMRQAVTARSEYTAFKYMVFLVTITKMTLLKSKFSNAIRGTVHPKKGQYSPHLVNQFTSIVPWHGIAVLRNNGRVDSIYESFILEQPHKYTAVYLENEYTPFYYREND